MYIHIINLCLINMQDDLIKKVMSLDYLVFDTLLPPRMVHLPNIDYTFHNGKLIYTKGQLRNHGMMNESDS